MKKDDIIALLILVWIYVSGIFLGIQLEILFTK